MTNLVLTRYAGERVVLYTDINGPKIVITVLAHGKSARLAISAPEEVCVDREEIYERKLANLSKDTNQRRTK